MRYFFSKSILNGDGSVTIPREKVYRWDMQMKTDYAYLPEEMKLSDRKEADKILEIVGQSIPKERLLEWIHFHTYSTDTGTIDAKELIEFIGSMEGKGYDIVGNPYSELHDEGCK